MAHLPVVRWLSKLGYCSRSQAVSLVQNGRVAVNGAPTRDPGLPCVRQDSISVDGLPITGARKRYVVLNKPRGIVTTRSDERGRRTIYDHMGPMEEWLAPVGRLDRDSEGLLLLTNDSRLAAWLTDPANAVPRVYEVTVRPAMEAQAVASLLRGVQIGGGEVAVPTHVRLLSTGTGAGVVELTLVEGKNREVRRIFRALSRRVLRLRRTRFGPFELGDLPTGQWRVEPLSEEEARRLRRPYSSQ